MNIGTTALIAWKLWSTNRNIRAIGGQNILIVSYPKVFVVKYTTRLILGFFKRVIVIIVESTAITTYVLILGSLHPIVEDGQT